MIVKSRVITVKRKKEVYTLDVDLKAPKDTAWKIGASMKGRSHLKGLTFEEEARYLPEIINVSATSQEFGKSCANHWRSISVPVDVDGLTLETGWRWNSEEDYEKEKDIKEEERKLGEPINVSDYVLYRYCLVYGRVANRPELVNATPKIRFYLESKDDEVKRDRTKLQKRLDANKAMLEVIGNRALVRAIIRAWDVNIDVHEMNEDELDIQLDTFATQRSDEFLKLYNDKDIMTKAFINEAIRLQKLTRAEHSETIMYGSTVVGKNMIEAVGNLKSGVEEFETIKNRLESEMKFGMSTVRTKVPKAADEGASKEASKKPE